jgi:hypothetical protein
MFDSAAAGSGAAVSPWATCCLTIPWLMCSESAVAC